MNRTKNATRNIIFGLLLRLYQIVVPFLMRSAMIYIMGVEYLGLNSLFSSVLQVLNLAELGVGSAMVFSMYKPIATQDKKRICALLKLYKKYYFFIGFVILVIGVSITPLIPRLISGEIPGNLNVYVLYLLNLFATVVSYWLFAYKNSLLQAHQRNDVSSKVMLVVNTVQYLIQLGVLLAFHNYYYYVIVMLMSQVAVNIITAVVASNLYPEYQPEGKLERDEIKSINQRIRDLFTAKLGATIVNSADTIVISAFLGLTILAMYQNYYFILTSVMGLLTTVFSSSLAGVGNSMVTESLEKNYNDFRVITFAISWIATICMSCFATMYQPFITIWVGEQYKFDNLVVALFCVYFYLVVMQQIPAMYKDAGGIWHQDRFRPLIAAGVNLLLNIFFVHVWGIYAILLSTILSYVFVSMPWMMRNVFKYVFKRSWKSYLSEFFVYFIVAVMISLLCHMLCELIPQTNLALNIMINLFVSILVSNIILYLVFRKNKYYNQMLKLIERMTHIRLTKIMYRN